MLGAGRSGHPPGRAGPAAGPGCPGRGGRGASCLEEGRGGVRAVRAIRSGLEDGPWCAVGVSSRGSLERPCLGGTTDRLGAADVVGSRVVQGARLPSGQGDVDVPGPSAPSVARSGPRGSVACGVGAVVVAASAAAPSEHHGSRCGCGSCGASGATGGLPEDGRELAGVVRGRVARVAPDGPRQQCGGVYEQRAADAPVAAQDGDAGLAGPEASVLELSRLP